MDEEEFDIYGDYDFSQSDDILDEITTEKPITSNKRTRTNDDKEEILEESVKNLKVPRHEEQKDEVKKKEQKVQSAAVYQNNNNVTIPQALTQLRGISTKPTQSIYLGELHWYTTDKIIKEPLKKANLLEQIKEMTFFEHKNNGKSKGIVFFEFTNKDYALQAKTIFDNTELDHKKVYAVFTTSTNPFKHLSKEINTNKSSRMPNNTIPRGGPMNSSSGFPVSAAAAAAAAAAMVGFMPSYGFPSTRMGYNEMMMMNNPNAVNTMRANNMIRPNRNTNSRMTGYQNYQQGNTNDGAGFRGMYINPAFFDGNNNNNNNNK